MHEINYNTHTYTHTTILLQVEYTSNIFCKRTRVCYNKIDFTFLAAIGFSLKNFEFKNTFYIYLMSAKLHKNDCATSNFINTRQTVC